ncbi:unnamed protein product [Adineta steineri]|uniref:G-protein coupled receptors family 1 profile domain-containing protein n=1 Tax=Adineta steineri TaxID=433720 RepID=A0A819IIJ5_9BILA|nr:unnamed protein product [Adineta steineri]
MSSLTDTISQLLVVQKYLYQIGCPSLMFIGTVSCIINLIVFTQKNLRRSPCTIYFIAYNIMNFLYIYTALLTLVVTVGYKIDLTMYNLAICRLRLYVTILFNCLSPFYLVLASIDRVFITSPNAHTRQRSTHRFAYMCIGIGTLFWSLFHTHLLITSTIVQIAPNTFLCTLRPGFETTFGGYYSLLEQILSLSSLIILGLWSIKNIRNSARRITDAPHLSMTGRTLENRAHSTSAKDRQLIFMLLMDVIIYALFSFVFAIFLMYQQITQYHIKSNQQIQIENIVRYLCLFITGIPFCISCYANLIVSKTFRNEIKKVIFRQ